SQSMYCASYVPWVTRLSFGYRPTQSLTFGTARSVVTTFASVWFWRGACAGACCVWVKGICRSVVVTVLVTVWAGAAAAAGTDASSTSTPAAAWRLTCAPSGTGLVLVASGRSRAGTQGASICRHIDATEDAAWRFRTPPETP